jgi:gluconolactonase
MSHQKTLKSEPATLSRRSVLGALGAGIVVVSGASAQPVAPPSTITNPPRDFSRRGAPTTYFTDPDILSVDPSFDTYAQPNSAIQRLWTGALWSEGPAWNAEGRYLVWSDIPNDRQLRWLEDDGHVSVFRMPSNKRMATASTSKAVSSPASTSRGGLCVMSSMAQSRFSLITTRASGSTHPMT